MPGIQFQTLRWPSFRVALTEVLDRSANLARACGFCRGFRPVPTTQVSAGPGRIGHLLACQGSTIAGRVAGGFIILVAAFRAVPNYQKRCAAFVSRDLLSILQVSIAQAWLRVRSVAACPGTGTGIFFFRSRSWS